MRKRETGESEMNSTSFRVKEAISAHLYFRISVGQHE